MEDGEPSPGGVAALGLRGVAAVLGGLAVLAGALLWLQGPRPLTIIVVSLDTTRLDHLSAFGYDRATTPTLARLAEQGVRFTNARTTTSWTLPSHMSLFTGLPHDLHDVTIDFQVLPEDRPIMGEIFRRADFRTAGIITAPYVHERFGFSRGMDFYEKATVRPMAYDLTPAEMDRQMGKLERFSHLEVTSKRVVGRARWLLDNLARPRNLLFLHFFDPHYDYYPPPKVRAQFVDPGYRGPVTGAEVQDPALVHADMPPADLAQLKALYDAEIRWVDDNLGELVEHLERQGLLGQVLLAVVADHGEEFFDDGRFGHRTTLREEVLRVPLLFWGPGLVPEGRTVDAPVALYDVLPTLMDYAGIAPDSRIYGRSLRPLLEGGTLPPRATTAALTFLHRRDDDGNAPDHYTRTDALVYEGLKYVRTMSVPWSEHEPTRLDNEVDPASARVAVYDLRRDPNERENLLVTAPDDPRIAVAVRAFEDETRRQLEHLQAQGWTGGRGPADEVEYDDILRSMQGVGYLGGAAGIGGPAAGEARRPAAPHEPANAGEPDGDGPTAGDERP